MAITRGDWGHRAGGKSIFALHLIGSSQFPRLIYEVDNRLVVADSSSELAQGFPELDDRRCSAAPQ